MAPPAGTGPDGYAPLTEDQETGGAGKNGSGTEQGGAGHARGPIVTRSPPHSPRAGDGLRNRKPVPTEEEIPGQKKGVPEMASEMFERMQSEHLPTFLSHLSIDPDGGLDKIETLWDPLKYVWFIMLIFGIMVNSFLLIHANWTVFEGFFYDYIEKVHETAQASLKNGLDVKKIQGGVAIEGGDAEALKKAQGGADIFVYCAGSVRNQIMGIATVTASFEVLGVLVYFFRVIASIWVFTRNKDPFKGYSALCSLFQQVLPNYGTFSAIKMMSLVHPSLVYANYFDYIRESSKSHTLVERVGLNLIFAFTRVLALFFAIMSFAIKLLAVGIRLAHPVRGSWMVAWLYIVALLNQCMGVVLIDQVLQERLFLFVFGGSDADFQDEERALKLVYMARVGQIIWEKYWWKDEKLKAIVMLATFDHYDMQKLLVEEDEDAKAETAGGESRKSVELMPPA